MRKAAAPDLRLLAMSGDRHGQFGRARDKHKACAMDRQRRMVGAPGAQTFASASGVGIEQGMQQRVQLAILRELHDRRSVGWRTTAVICPPGTSVNVRARVSRTTPGPSMLRRGRQELPAIAAAGRRTLTETGQRRLNDG
jgi:hypothetical protein